jgi:peptide/nickel transport system substrate-binding protein
MRPTANIMLTLAYQSTAKWNDSYWKNAMFDDLLIKARSVTDPAARKQVYADLQTMVHEDAGTVIPVHRNFIDAINSNLRGFPRAPVGPYGGLEGPEFFWIDA